MFIKKIKKDKKVYYMLVLVIQNGRDKQPEFHSMFIPDRLAEWLAKTGIVVKEKGE